ncbi:MAG: hypothetical protein HF978_13715 [Desulfobacteraceae bacterium]|nr:hypothetical protein [Desulfobacteraceae bacterium]MBC2756600.1 hypothetical protein [Desulfobacteraceae bacterium]
MRKKKFPIIDDLAGNATIKINPQVKDLHPVVEQLIIMISHLNFINFIRISPEDIQASSELTQGRVKIPISEQNHPTASGVHLIIHKDFNDIQFYEINSAVKGHGGKMVDAIMKALPENWRATVVMDWSQGFWEKMTEKYSNLELL